MKFSLRLAVGIVLAMLFTLLSSVASTADPVSTKRDSIDCSNFDKESRGYYVGALQTFRNAGGPLQDPFNLDGDRDGYPCEDLAKKTEAKGEPSCSANFCARRSTYRMFFWLTGVTRGDVENDNGKMAYARRVESTRANVMALFAPTVAKNSSWGTYLNDFVKMAYYDVSPQNINHAANCTNSVRNAVLNAIKSDSLFSYDAMQAWEDNHNYFQKSLKKTIEKLGTRIIKGTLYAGYVPKYVEIATQIGQAAIQQQLEDNQRKFLFNQVVTGC